MASSSDPTVSSTPDDGTETLGKTSAPAAGQYLAASDPAGDVDAAGLPAAIGRYRVTGLRGRGGMGVVVSAEDPELKRAVALKLLRPGASTRLEREAQAMAKLSHPNVVTVHEVSRDAQQPYIVMELVTGGTLRDWLGQEARPWRRVVEMLVAAGRGLAAAHDAGLVHRDFKPENVLVGSDGRPRVTDFGLVSSATAADASGALAGATTVGGTPAYMPPEQWAGADLDARSDQYAFAVTCWEALWGERPFSSQRPTVDEATSREPRRLRSRRGAPRRLEAALRRALRSDREQRWPTLAALLDRLERIGRDRRPFIAAAAVVTVGLVGLVAFPSGMGGGATESPCRAAGSPLDDAWTKARVAALRETYAERNETYVINSWMNTEQTLQGWVDEHRALRVETCELGRAGGAGAKEAVAARAECLDRRLTSFRALVTTLEQPDATMPIFARGAALGLPRSTGCRSATPAEAGAVAGPMPPREKLAEAQERVAQASALRQLGNARAALAVAQATVVVADELGWKPLIATAYFELGLAFHGMRDPKAAEPALQRAILFADASRDDVIRFEATIRLAENAQERRSFDESARAIESARMIAGRLPEDAAEENDIAIEGQVARLSYWRAEYADCEARNRRLVERVEKVYGRTHRFSVDYRIGLARCLQNLGRTSENGVILREALEILEATSGREHPMAADVMMGLGAIARAEDRPADALPLLEESLAIRNRIFGPDNPETAKLLNNIGNVLDDLGRVDEARQRIERALAIWEKAYGPDSPAVGVASNNLGRMALAQGDLVAAEKYLTRMIAIRRASFPAGHPDLASGLVRMGELLIVKRDRAALPLLREAVAAYKTNEAPPAKKDEGTFMLGRALFELGTDRAEGRKLMDSSCGAYDTKNDPFDCRAYLSKLDAR